VGKLNLIGRVCAANIGISIIRQSVSLVSVGCAISAEEWALGVGSGQEADGGQGQFDFGAARHRDGTD
jgi:tetrahydromethanopterin S-methyltransferase subunit D